MKLLGLVAAATASPVAWVTENWWNEAINVYNFAVNNPTEFADAVNSVGAATYEPLFNFCGGVDGSIDSNELTTCAAKIANFVQMSDASQNYLYDFGAKYWDVVDYNSSGDLDFEEFKLAIGAFAATNARVVVNAYDSNGDNILSGAELTAWKDQVFSTGANWGWSLSDAQYAALQAAYADAQVKIPLVTLDPNSFSLSWTVTSIPALPWKSLDSSSTPPTSSSTKQWILKEFSFPSFIPIFYSLAEFHPTN